MMGDFLQGYRVLDLSQYIPGPFATLMLSNMGAEVVKVEPPTGDPMRSFLAQDEDGLSPFYKQLNRGKTVTVIDLKSEDGKQLFRALVEKADILLESFRPGVMGRLGFSTQELATINPGLIHCALSGFGQSGPYRERAGHDLTYNALAGGLSVSGVADRPVMTFPPMADHAGAMQAVTAILGALVGRQKSGKGAYLDVSLAESVLAWQYIGLGSVALGDEPKRENDPLNGGLACYNIYETKDGRFVALASLEKKFWENFCKTVGRSDWIDRHYEELPQNGLIAELRELFVCEDLGYWKDCLDPVDCCFEAILNLSEVAEHPQIAARQLLNGSEPLLPFWCNGMPSKPKNAMVISEADAVRLSWFTESD